MSDAQPLGAPSSDHEPLRAGPHLHLVPDTLETLLTRVVTELRSSLPDAPTAEVEFGSACRRDAVAVIEAGHAAGLLKRRKSISSDRG